MTLRARLGIGVGCDRVSAVLVVRGVVRWAASRPRAGEATLGETITALLGDRPRARVLGPRITVAIGPHGAQVKHIAGLPPLEDARALAAVVRGQAGRFFLDFGTKHLFSAARVDSPGCAWIAAFSEPVVDEIVEACRRVGLRIHRIVPTAVALRAAIEDDEIAWCDGDVRLAIAYAGSQLRSVRRVPGGADGAMAIPRLVSPLSRVAAHAADLLDAAGAAYLNDHGALAFRGVDVRRRPARSRRRLAVPAIACGIAVALAAAAPGMASWFVRHKAAERARGVGKLAHSAALDGRALAATSDALTAFADFAHAHGSMTVLLAQLTRALPEQAAVVALQVDSTDAGNIVAVAPHAAAVVDALERVPSLASPVIVGPVTQETHGGRTVERVTVRFRVVALGMGVPQ